MITTTKLTNELDAGRYYLNSSIVELSNGRKLVLYEKFLTSGRTSNSRTTKTAAFTISVEAGSGTILETPVTWQATALQATPDTFQVVYVDTNGTVSITDDFPMTLANSVIILAYANVGLGEIVYLEEVEKTGKYIYGQKQELVGGSWVWTGYEYVLNTGEQPKAIYQASQQNIVLTYIKNSSVYVRLLDPLDETTWNFLLFTRIENDVISLINQPSSTMYLSGIDASLSSTQIVNEIIRLDYTYTSPVFALESQVGGSLKKLLRPPFVDFSPNNGDVSQLSFEVYKFENNAWILEEEYAVRDYSERLVPYVWDNIDDLTAGLKQIYIKFYTVYFIRYSGVAQYLRLPYDALSQTIETYLLMQETQDYFYVDSNGNIVCSMIEPIRANGPDGIFGTADSVSCQTNYTQFDESRQFCDDSVNLEGVDSTTSETTVVSYVDSFTFVTDTANLIGADASIASCLLS